MSMCMHVQMYICIYTIQIFIHTCAYMYTYIRVYMSTCMTIPFFWGLFFYSLPLIKPSSVQIRSHRVAGILHMCKHVHVHDKIVKIMKLSYIYGHIWEVAPKKIVSLEYFYRKGLSYIWTCIHIYIFGRTSQNSVPERFYKVDAATRGLLTRQQGKTLKSAARRLLSTILHSGFSSALLAD